MHHVGFRSCLPLAPKRARARSLSFLNDDDETFSRQAEI